MLMQSSLRAKLQEAFRLRMYFFMGVAGVVFAILALQLINLQLIQGKFGGAAAEAKSALKG